MVQIDKETVLNLLRECGAQEQAQQAEQDLPEQADPDRDAGR